MMGVELEVYARRPAALCNFAEELGIAPEDDGSLSSRYGVELVGPPMTLEQYQSGKSPWHTFFRVLKEQENPFGIEKRKGYGMHVHVSGDELERSDALCSQTLTISALMAMTGAFTRFLSKRHKCDEWKVNWENSSFNTTLSLPKGKLSELPNPVAYLAGQSVLSSNLHDQCYGVRTYTAYNTSEIRPYASTTDFDLFLARVEHARYMFDFAKANMKSSRTTRPSKYGVYYDNVVVLHDVDMGELIRAFFAGITSEKFPNLKEQLDAFRQKYPKYGRQITGE